MRISNPKDMGGNKLLHRVNVATGGLIQGDGTEANPLTANKEALASTVFPNFSGNSGKVLRVNANETGTEWADAPTGGEGDASIDVGAVRYVKDYNDYLAVSELANKQNDHYSVLFQASADISGDFIKVKKSVNGDVVDNALRKGRTYLRYNPPVGSNLQQRTVTTSTYVVEKVRFISRDSNNEPKDCELLSGRGDDHYIFPDSFEKASQMKYGFTFKNRETADAALNGGWPTKEVDINALISAYKAELEKEETYIGSTPWYLADKNVGITSRGEVYKKYEGAWHFGSVDCQPSLEFSEAFEATREWDMVFLYKDSNGNYTETPTPNSTETTTENNGQFTGLDMSCNIDITQDSLCMAIHALEGTSLEVFPGKAYSATLTANSTLTATGGEDGYRQEAFLDVNPVTYSLTPGGGLTFAQELTANKVNYCRIVWHGLSARLLVDDVTDAAASGGGGTDAGTITTSSQTITGTAGTSLSYNLANYVTVSNGQTPTFTLASGQVLPAGLSLSSSGVISGTPEASSSATIRVNVSASNCPDVEMTVTFNIAEAIQQGTITITKTPKISGVVGTAISPYNLSSCVTVSNGKTPSFSWNESYYPKPAWLNLTETGVLSGTPSGIPEAGRVTVSADNCTSVNLDITWDIINAGTITIGNQTINGTVGNAVSLNLGSSTTVSNGQTPTFAVKSGNTLPAGIELSTAGVLSGTPTATSSATVVVTITARGCPDKEVSITFNITEAQAVSDGFPVSFTVTESQGLNGQSCLGTYTRTGNTLALDGVNYPVYSFTNASGKVHYIHISKWVYEAQQVLGTSWILDTRTSFTAESPIRVQEVYGTSRLKAGTYEPSSTYWNGDAGAVVVSWEMGAEGETPSDGWPTKIVVSNATSSSGDDVSAFNGDYVRTGETLSILGEDVPIWSNGSKYIYGIPNDAGTPMSEPAIALFDSTGNDDTFFCYYYRMKSGASTSWKMGTGNSMGLTVTITEVSGGESGGTKEYVYTVTGVTNPYEAANGDYYATGEMKNDYPVYTNGTYSMYYVPTDWTGWTIGKSDGSGSPGIYKTGSTDPIGNWNNGVVVSAYSGSSSGGESSSSSSGSEEPAPSDGWPTTITVSDATATGADSSWSGEWNGTYTRTGDTTTALGETIPVWSNGKYYVNGYGTYHDSALPEVGIGFFINKNDSDRGSSYYYRAKSATTWTSGPYNGPGLTMTITENYTSGGEPGGSSSSSSGETGGGVTYTMSRTSGTDSYVANAIGTYSLESGTDGSTDAVYVNENGWHISYSTSNGRWGVGPLAGDEKFICSTLEGTYTSWDYECNDVIVLKKDGEGGAITFPESFSVTDCSGNGAATGTYTKTSNTTTVNGTDYPVYSFTHPIMGTTFYIFVCDKFNGASGAYWALNGDSEYSSTMDGNNTLGAVSVGSDGLPSSTTWTAQNSRTATVSWT